MSDSLREALDEALAENKALRAANTKLTLAERGRIEAALSAPPADAEAVASVVPCYTPSGKRVALYTEHQELPIGTKLYTAPPSQSAQMRKALEKLRETNAAEYLRLVARETSHVFDKHEISKVADLIDEALSRADEGKESEGER